MFVLSRCALYNPARHLCNSIRNQRCASITLYLLDRYILVFGDKFFVQEAATMSVSLADLPNEVIFQILLYVPLDSTPTLLLVSRRFNEAAQPLLWRFHCRTQYRYWSEEHDIKQKFSNNALQVEWKSLFARRHSVDCETNRTINSIIGSQLDRINKSEKIVRLGYDVKDTLLRNIHVGEDGEDVLARQLVTQAEISVGMIQR